MKNVAPCNEDHMHSWQVNEESVWICTNQTRDTPGPVDAEISYIISSTEWVPVKGTEMLRDLVERAKNQIAAEVESAVWEEPEPMQWAKPVNTDVAPPLQFADLLRLTMDKYDDAIEQEHKRWLNSPFYKIMRERQTEICLLYGTMTNYFLVMEYKPQPEDAAQPA